MTKPTKKKFDSLIDNLGRSKRTIAKTISTFIQFNTENPGMKDHEIQLIIKDELRASGLHVELCRPGDHAVALTSSQGRGLGGLILYGHADVVPAGNPNKWKYPPYSGTIVGDRVYGRGAADMKAGLVAAMFAYKLIAENDFSLGGKLEFVSVLDEEAWHKTPTGWGTSDWLLKTGKLAGKACIMGEPGGVRSIGIGERGDYWARLTCDAEPAHGSMPVYDENACVKMFALLNEIHEAIQESVDMPAEIKSIVKSSSEVLSKEMRRMKVEIMGSLLNHYTMNVGLVSGGTMVNVVPEHCEVSVAFCVPLGATRKALEKKLMTLLEKSKYRNIKLRRSGEVEPDPSYTSPSSRIVRTLSDAGEKVLGEHPHVCVSPGTSDAVVFRKNGVQTCFYGPGKLEHIHGYNESVSVRDTITTTKVYLKTISEYVGFD
jgi:succinyl-diaminopimelate desuccinylase